MEAYIRGLIPNLAQLRDMLGTFVQMYCRIAAHKFFFFCDPNRRGLSYSIQFPLHIVVHFVSHLLVLYYFMIFPLLLSCLIFPTNMNASLLQLFLLRESLLDLVSDF